MDTKGSYSEEVEDEDIYPEGTIFDVVYSGEACGKKAYAEGAWSKGIYIVGIYDGTCIEEICKEGAWSSNIGVKVEKGIM